MRVPLQRLTCVVAGLVLVACSSDHPTQPAASAGSASFQYEFEDLPLSQAITSLSAALFPRGLETASGTRWQNVTEKLAAGQTSVAQAQFAELAKWIEAKIPQMDALQGGTGETTPHAATRLLLYMGTYLYGTDKVTVPSVGGDVAFALVLPTEAKTIVTPLQLAGVALPAGAVNAPTLVIVSEHQTRPDEDFSAPCSGPLNTSLCQYPLFYEFDAFPHERLLIPARFGVCRVDVGGRDPSESAHQRIRLAHDLPADPANYTEDTPYSSDVPYSDDEVIRTEGIEILERVGVSDFLTNCPVESAPALMRTASTPLGKAWALVASLSGAALERISPKPAFAAGMRRIDQGVGGKGFFFSHFNKVDAQVVTSMSVSPGTPATPIGGAVQFTAYDQHSQPIVDRPVTWSSSDPGVATVTPAGLVTSHSAGTVTITAAAGTVTGTATLTVQGQLVGANLCSAPAYGTYGSSTRTEAPACVLRLTSAAPSQAGAAWTNSGVPVSDGFVTTFSFRFSGPGGACDNAGQCGADGIAFVIQTAGSNVVGGGGGEIGYHGIPRSVAVEFDTWKNDDFGDPGSNHVSVNTMGTLANSVNHAASLGSAVVAGDMNDGQTHTGRIEYVPGTMRVFVDGVEVLVVTIHLTSIDGASILDAGGRAWVGFTSATGAAFAQQDIVAWNFNPGPPPVAVIQ